MCAAAPGGGAPGEANALFLLCGAAVWWAQDQHAPPPRICLAGQTRPLLVSLWLPQAPTLLHIHLHHSFTAPCWQAALLPAAANIRGEPPTPPPTPPCKQLKIVILQIN